MPVKSIRSFIFCLCLSVVLVAGCVYRPEIHQGQTVETEDVERITQGMSPDEVREILGTPLVTDAFNDGRWDYVYNSFDRSRTQTELSVVSIFFKDGVVDSIDTRSQEAEIVDQTNGVTVKPREEKGWFGSLKQRFSDFRERRKKKKSEE